MLYFRIRMNLLGVVSQQSEPCVFCAQLRLRIFYFEEDAKNGLRNEHKPQYEAL